MKSLSAASKSIFHFLKIKKKSISRKIHKLQNFSKFLPSLGHNFWNVKNQNKNTEKLFSANTPLLGTNSQYKLSCARGLWQRDTGARLSVRAFLPTENRVEPQNRVWTWRQFFGIYLLKNRYSDINVNSPFCPNVRNNFY